MLTIMTASLGMAPSDPPEGESDPFAGGAASAALLGVVPSSPEVTPVGTAVAVYINIS